MAESRVWKRKIRTRARLVESVYLEMSAKGVDHAAVQEITDRADVGLGTFYCYFSSKDEITTCALDCVIHNLGQRNQMANDAANIADALAVISNSVRLTAIEILTDPMWRLWLRRTDLMARRMHVGFRPFGIRDLSAAQTAGQVIFPDGQIEAAWGYLIWLLAGAITDIVEGVRAAASDMAEAIMRVVGASTADAKRLSSLALPTLPAAMIDFTYTPNKPEQIDLVLEKYARRCRSDSSYPMSGGRVHPLRRGSVCARCHRRSNNKRRTK